MSISKKCIAPHTIKEKTKTLSIHSNDLFKEKFTQIKIRLAILLNKYSLETKIKIR